MEICDDVIKLGEDGSTNDANEEKSDVALSEEDSTNEIGELPKSSLYNFYYYFTRVLNMVSHLTI